MTEDETLTKLSGWKEESRNLRTTKDYRNSLNLKLIKGIFRNEENAKSTVRNRQKSFFRKIWATTWRLTATMHQAFMKDPETFRIIGRDIIDDPRKAKVLQKMCEFRRDKMNYNDSLFLKFIWAIQGIFNYGFVCGKMTWNYNEKLGKDDPEFVLYPFEQVYPDMIAEYKDKMRYIHFLNYITKVEMEELGYDTEGLVPVSPETNQLRNVRYHNDNDPQNYAGDSVSYIPLAGGTYPTPGTAPDTQNEDAVYRYKVYESFWKEDGKVMYGVSHNFETWLKKPKESGYGNKFPIVMGQCLTEAHKLMGEGFPEPLEAPQESYNYNLNMRKDNLATAMTGQTYVQRGSGVDLQSLVKRKINGIIMMDDVNSVKYEPMPDVTGSSYAEAGIDESQMDEMSGVTPGKRGMEAASKATVAQINYQESNAKIELYVAIVGETFFRDFYRELSRQIQIFETDEIVFRVANEQLRKEEEDPYGEEVYDVSDIVMDCIVDIGPGTVGQNVHIQQTMLAMDRAIMTLQASAQLASIGAVPPEGMKIPNVTKFFEVLLPYLGHRNVSDFFITMPQAQGEGSGMGSPTGQGGGGGTTAEMLQAGSLGGI